MLTGEASDLGFQRPSLVGDVACDRFQLVVQSDAEFDVQPFGHRARPSVRVGKHRRELRLQIRDSGGDLLVPLAERDKLHACGP